MYNSIAQLAALERLLAATKQQWIKQFITNQNNSIVCSFARLFAKLPRPGDCEVTFSVFESSCHLLLPV